MEKTQRREPRLRRELGLFSTTMLGMGGAICAGVFVTLGYASTLAGTSLILVMVFGGVINLLTMLSFAELGSALPHAGGEYTFVRIAYEGFMPFATGWFEWTSNIFYASFSALGFGNLLSYVFPGVNVPLVAVVTILAFTLLNIKGIKEAGLVEAGMVLVLLCILVAFIARGLSTPSVTDLTISSPQGLFGLLRASAFVFVVYLGGEAIVAAQAEIKSPEKTISRAIVISCLALIVIYTLITFVVFRTVTPEELASQASPLSFVADRLMGGVGVVLITFAGVMAALTSVNTSIMAQARVAYAMGRDGYFPSWCHRLHGSYCTPYLATALGSSVAVATALLGGINFVTYATDFGFIMGFIFVNLALMSLRSKMPLLKRPFRVPLYPVTPILGLATSLLLIAFLDATTLIMGAILLVVGGVIYRVRMNGKRLGAIDLEDEAGRGVGIRD
jgi:amino acid transporter